MLNYTRIKPRSRPSQKKSAYFKQPDFSAAKIEKKCTNYAANTVFTTSLSRRNNCFMTLPYNVLTVHFLLWWSNDIKMNFTVSCDVMLCGLRGSKQRFMWDGRATSVLRMETAVNCKSFTSGPSSKSHIQEDRIQSDKNQPSSLCLYAV